MVTGHQTLAMANKSVGHDILLGSVSRHNENGPATAEPIVPEGKAEVA